MAHITPKPVRMHTIIDINGLNKFYGDSYFGKESKPKCNADSFSKFMASEGSFSGLDGNVFNWEKNCVYTWEVYTLNKEPLTLKIGNEENLICLKMICNKEVPTEDDWKQIIKFDDNIDYNTSDGTLHVKASTSVTTMSTFIIKTTESIKQNINLTYSIEFSFGEERHGKIDPFIEVRSDDPNALL